MFRDSVAEPKGGEHRASDAGGAQPVRSGPADSPTKVCLKAGQITSSKEKLRLRLYVALLALDVVSIGGAFLLANLLRFSGLLVGSGTGLFFAILPIFIGLAASKGAYSLGVLERPQRGIRLALQSFFLAVAAVLGLLFYTKASADFSRVVFAVGTVLSFIFLNASRYAFGQWAGRLFNWNFTNRVVVVDGVHVFAGAGDILLQVDSSEFFSGSGKPVVLDRLGRLLKNSDRVIVACPEIRREAWAAVLKGIDMDIEFLAPELDRLGALEARRLGDHATVLISRGPLALRDRMLKRAFDLGVATPALLLSLPLFGIIAIAIKLDSQGPVLFRQPRIGLGNRIFDVLKFRSMQSDAEDDAGVRSASLNDDRVTRVGGFLRRTSLDELPQLINVLLGEMSLVGPRPHAVASTAEGLLFWEVDSSYFMRHAVKPGITGLAQVRGHRGATLRKGDLENRLQSDLEYLTGWTIWREIGILLSTMRVLSHKNAF